MYSCCVRWNRVHKPVRRQIPPVVQPSLLLDLPECRDLPHRIDFEHAPSVARQRQTAPGGGPGLFPSYDLRRHLYPPQPLELSGEGRPDKVEGLGGGGYAQDLRCVAGDAVDVAAAGGAHSAEVFVLSDEGGGVGESERFGACVARRIDCSVVGARYGVAVVAFWIHLVHEPYSADQCLCSLSLAFLVRSQAVRDQAV